MSQLTTAPPELQAVASAELTLRVCGTAQNGRLVRLRGLKCTIGSDSQCTLRLRAAGVSPLHCLIVRGDDRTIVRGLSGITRINGHDISEAKLARGDRLMIGTIEFEVVDGLADNSRSSESFAEKHPIAPAIAEPAAPGGVDTLVDTLIAERKEAARLGRGRTRRLLNQVREARREQELVNLRLTRSEESGEGLGQALAESQAECQRLREVQSRLESAANDDNESRRQCDEQRQAVEQERAAIEQARKALEQERLSIEEERRHFGEERTRFEQERLRVNEDRGNFEQERLALAQAKQQVEQERLAFAEAQARFEQERLALAQTKQQVEQEQSAFAEAQARLEQERSALAQTKQQVEQEHSAVIERQRQLEQERSEFALTKQHELSTLAEARQQLELERGTTARELGSIEQERAALAQQRSAVESQQLLLQQELRAFEEHKHSLTAERLDWQTEASKAEAELAGRRQELEQRAAAIEKQQADQEAARRRVDESQKAIGKRQETLQQAEHDLLERKRQAQEQEQALIAVRKAFEKNQARLDADRQSLADEQAKLTEEKQSLAELRQQGTAHEDQASRQLAEQARQLTEACERLKVATKDLANQQELAEAMRQEFDVERQQWESERAKLRFEFEQAVASSQSTTSQVELTCVEIPADESTAPQEFLSFETDLECESECEVVARETEELEIASAEPERLTHVSDELEEPTGTCSSQDIAERDESGGAIDEQLVDAAENEDQIVAADADQPQEELSFAQEDSLNEPRAAADKPHESDEESIDDYMTRLLKRVQNIGQRNRPTAGNPSPPAAPPATTPAATAAPEDSGATASASTGEGSAMQEVLARLSRRAAAPELSSDIAAMRELANMSARAAIDKHAYRNWGRAAFGKFTIALLAAAAGVGAVHFAAAPDSMLMYAGLLSFVVALFWLLQAGILLKNVFDASRRNARMTQALCNAPQHEAPAHNNSPDNSHDNSHDHARDADELPPAEIIAVADG